jgi:PilZ domain
MRAGTRFTLLIRPAKIVRGGEEFLCIVRDVSETGIRLRLFHELAIGDPVELVLSNEERYRIAPVWQSKLDAGFSFDKAVPLRDFIAEKSPFARRTLRLRVQFPVELRTRGAIHEGLVLDLSKQGARVRTDGLMSIRETIALSAEGLPQLHGTVCWRAGQEYGLAFRECLSLEELAIFAAWRQGYGPASVRSQALLKTSARPFMQ